MTVGERIKAKRLELGMSQEELAKKCGYKSRSSINKIELERDLPLRKVEQLARALNTEPAYLMGWEEPSRDWIQTFASGEAKHIAETQTDPDFMLLTKYYSLLSDAQKKSLLDLIKTMIPNMPS